ncbi:hypothetical protein AZH53_00665 [Methanomicrobiaceae archaeon CYW5]|uniref:DUF7507 domain-containing protein n=1 Tax=Methanovulcanius yangii TaxID=1789227 RepID=UPI0029CA80A6|nr:hypothetical protein [Methanovulcanius yangii]MBT8506942.1 hypothetical protein [Methanovulcanius yangii]
MLWVCFVIGLVLLCTGAGAAATPGEIGDSIDDGIDWLVSVQNADGSWGPAGSDRYGTTGLILVKLEDRAFELGYDGPFDPDYPLKDNVEDGLGYLLPYANTMAISVQAAGNADTNGNGLGVSVNNRIYDTGILMMAIAAGRDPDQVVASGPLAGWTYGEVLQDLTDYMAYAQTDAGNGRGGWYYNAVSGGSSADQSNAGYAMLGILYAVNPFYGYECDLPAFVEDELDYWIDYIQSDWIPAGVNEDWDGGSGYTVPDNWVNSLKTGNLLTQMAFVGDDSSDERVQEALNYIGRHWDEDWVQGWGMTGSVQYQATYCLMKGFESMGTSLDGVPGVADWYDDMATEIIGEQNADGSWPSTPAYIQTTGGTSHWVSKELSTAWALLTLERFAPPPPEADFNVVKSASDTVVSAGESVTYSYYVENNGDLPIVDVVLTDDQLGVIAGPDSGDTDGDGELDPGETWVYTATTTVLETTTNTAEATGADPAGAPLDATSNEVTVTVEGAPPVPEFPALYVPLMVIGAVFLLAAYVRRK